MEEIMAIVMEEIMEIVMEGIMAIVIAFNLTSSTVEE